MLYSKCIAASIFMLYFIFNTVGSATVPVGNVTSSPAANTSELTDATNASRDPVHIETKEGKLDQSLSVKISFENSINTIEDKTTPSPIPKISLKVLCTLVKDL